jgi:acyl-CoA synthetase (AMP-forming)/AMP-acid ligase II
VTLARVLELAAQRWPQAEAVVDGDRRLTYAQLHRQARALGAAFHRLGVAPGDRVLIALRNRLEHVIAYWALQTIAAVPVPVNFRFAPTEMRYVLEDSGARLALVEASTAAAVQPAADARDLRLIFVGTGAAPAGSVPFESLMSEGLHSGGGGGAPAPPSRAISR